MQTTGTGKGDAGSAGKARSADGTRNSARLFHAQVRMMYDTANPGLMHTLLIVLVAAMYWGVSETFGLSVWLATALGLSVARFLLVWAFHREQPPDNVLLFWDRAYMVAVFLTGVSWGSAAFLLYPPDNTVYQVALAFVVGGISASATVSLAARREAFWFAVAPAMVLLILRFLLDQAPGHFEMAILLLLYFAVLFNIGRSAHTQLQETLRLRFENEDLVRSLESNVVELEAARTDAEQSSSAKTRFLASASHDLRQPVHALGLFVSALGRRMDGDAEGRAIFNNIVGSLNVVTGLLDSLLDISKLDAGVVEPRVETVALQPLLNQIANEFDGPAEEKGLHIRVACPDLSVASDSLLLGRIVRNLMSNAVRYTADGGVLLSARRCAGDVLIQVWDTGPGISDSNQRDVFQEFFQLRTPSRDGQSGLGLGLSIVQRTCDLLGHEIALTSVPGRGTRFTVRLPQAAQRRPEADAPQETTSGTRSADAGLAALLIEDDALSATAMSSLLSEWGMTSETASAKNEIAPALARLGRRPDFIMSDFRLANDETGDRAVHTAFEEIGEEVPVIFVTGDTGPERLQVLVSRGYQVLHKPVPPARLRALIRHLVADAGQD